MEKDCTGIYATGVCLKRAHKIPGGILIKKKNKTHYGFYFCSTKECMGHPVMNLLLVSRQNHLPRDPSDEFSQEPGLEYYSDQALHFLDLHVARRLRVVHKQVVPGGYRECMEKLPSYQKVTSERVDVDQTPLRLSDADQPLRPIDKT